MSYPSATDPQPARRRRWTPRKTMATVALATAGVAGGAVLGATVSAGATTPSTSAATSTSSTSSGAPTSGASAPASGAPTGSRPSGSMPAYRVPGLSGTVTAVGSSSVTIKSSTGTTTTYAVTSSSDIDKNGEATLSDLKVGDAVTYSVESGTSTPTIDKLHAGSEALDRPSGPPSGAPSGGPSGAPAGSGSAA